MQTRKLVMSLAALVIMVCLIIIGWQAFGPDAVRLPKERIQALVDKQMPYTLPDVDVTVSNTKVEFIGNELVLNLDVAGQGLGQTFSLSAITVGKPTYRNGSFYFEPSNVVLKNVVVGASDRSVAGQISDLTKRHLPGNERAKDALDKLAPSVEAWVHKRVIIAVGNILRKVPVYTLPDDAKGFAAKAVLGEVSVVDDELVITFTLWRLTGWVLVATLAFLSSLGMLIALLRNPALLVGVVVLTGGL